MDPITDHTISEHSTTEQGLAQSNTSEHFLISFNPYIHINFGEKQMRFMGIELRPAAHDWVTLHSSLNVNNVTIFSQCC